MNPMTPLIARLKALKGPRLYAVAFIFAFLLAFLRHPEALLRPQFWAEDGAVWYQQAHELGATRPFLLTQDGYYSTYLRVAALLAQAVPLADAPLLMNLIALALQAAPAVFFLSPRFKDAVPGPSARLALAVLYLLLPNTAEIHGNATNAQWYLALLAFMIIVARPPASKAGRVADVATLALAGLSGPYAFFLTPMAALRWRSEKNYARLTQTRVLAVTAVVQALALFVLNAGSRFGYRPHVDLVLLWGILEKQIFGGGIVGMQWYHFVRDELSGAAVFAIMTVAGLALTVAAALRGPWQMRFLLFFAGASLAASLLAPNIGSTAGPADYARRAWQTLFDSSSGSRYWFLPILALVVVIAWSRKKTNPLGIRLVGTALFCLLLAGTIGDFRDPPLADLRFSEYALAYVTTPPGEAITIPLNPPGWSMMLTKKGP
jgi:hypothetical protein